MHGASFAAWRVDRADDGDSWPLRTAFVEQVASSRDHVGDGLRLVWRRTGSRNGISQRWKSDAKAHRLDRNRTGPPQPDIRLAERAACARRNGRGERGGPAGSTLMRGGAVVGRSSRRTQDEGETAF